VRATRLWLLVTNSVSGLLSALHHGKLGTYEIDLPPAERNDFPAPHATENAKDDWDKEAGVAYRLQQFDSLRHVIGAHRSALDLRRVNCVSRAARNDLPANGMSHACLIMRCM
jgi:hypothetical protein